MDPKRVRIATVIAVVVVVLNVALVLVTYVRTGNWTLDWRATDFDTVLFQDRTYNGRHLTTLPDDAVPCGQVSQGGSTARIFLGPMEVCGEGTPLGIYLDTGDEVLELGLAGGP